MQYRKKAKTLAALAALALLLALPALAIVNDLGARAEAIATTAESTGAGAQGEVVAEWAGAPLYHAERANAAGGKATVGFFGGISTHTPAPATPAMVRHWQQY